MRREDLKLAELKGIEKGKLEGKLEAARTLIGILDLETISKRLEIPIDELKKY